MVLEAAHESTRDLIQPDVLGLRHDQLSDADSDDVEGLIERMTSGLDWLGSTTAQEEYQRRGAQDQQNMNHTLTASYEVAQAIVERATLEFNAPHAVPEQYGGGKGIPYHRAKTILAKFSSSLSTHTRSPATKPQADQSQTKVSDGWLN